jgi:glycosyltransferase involved in cell wall biosynthesis
LTIHFKRETLPKISVIIPTFNRAALIGDAIQSVIAQTYLDWEAIVIDDGSMDDTRSVVENFADPRIRYLYQENKGLPGARNTGIRSARGEYIAFLDSDDLFMPHKLEIQLRMLEERPDLGLVAGGHLEIDQKMQILREVRPWQSQSMFELSNWVQGCPFIVNAVLVRREWLERVNLFDENMPYVEDWDLWLRISHVGCRMDWIKNIVCYYRLHNKNMVRNAFQMKQGMLRMLDKLYAQPNLPIEIVEMQNRAYANIYLNAAARAYASSDIGEGKEWLTKAIELDSNLLIGEPPRFLDNLASFALTPLAGNACFFIERVVENLPDRIDVPHWSKRKARGLLWAVTAFDSYRRQDYKNVSKYTFLAYCHDWVWMFNRGLFLLNLYSQWRRFCTYFNQSTPFNVVI